MFNRSGFLILFSIVFSVATFLNVAIVEAKSSKRRVAKVSKKMSKTKKQKKAVKSAVASWNTWRMMPREAKIQYILILREGFLKLNKEFVKANKKDFAQNKVNQLDSLLDMLMEPAVAANRNVGDSCMYAGWPSTYQQYDGWSRPYCVPPGEDGRTGVVKGADPIRSWAGQSYCSAGQILCNPALYGLGKNRRGYCVNRNGSAFQNCQKQYRDDRGYPATAIADQLVADDNALGGYAAIKAMRDFINEHCAQDYVKKGQRRQCDIVKRRLDKLDEKWGDRPKNDAPANVTTDDDGDEDEAGKAKPSDVCLSRSFSVNDSRQFGVSGVGSCISCALDMEMAANKGGTERVSDRYLDFISMADKECGGSGDPAAALELAHKLGSCKQSTFSYSNGLGGDALSSGQRQSLMTKFQNYIAGRADNTEGVHFLFGVRNSADFKAMYCGSGGSGLRAASEISSALQAYETPSGLSGAFESALGQASSKMREEMVACLQEAAGNAGFAKTCSYAAASNNTDTEEFMNTVNAQIEKGLPSIVKTSPSGCATIVANGKNRDGEIVKDSGEFDALGPDGAAGTVSLGASFKPATPGGTAIERNLQSSGASHVNCNFEDIAVPEGFRGRSQDN